MACAIYRNLVNKIHKWEAWLERILTEEVRELEGKVCTIIVVYGPNEGNKVVNKETFWEELNKITEQCDGKVYLLGDFNSWDKKLQIYRCNQKLWGKYQK